ncbi:MAG: VanZ family protein [Clostridia bacterium]|nr:VanZ family protein [Clostridia bacterium]
MSARHPGARTVLRAVFLVLTLAVCAAIFVFSGEDREKTTAHSAAFADNVARQVVNGYEQMSEREKTAETNYIEKTIRKFGHAVEYMALGAFCALFFLTFSGETPTIRQKKKKRKSVPRGLLILFSFLFCILYAISDEVHQLFVPGRLGSALDVVLDAAAALTAILTVSGAVCVFLDASDGQTPGAEAAEKSPSFEN